MQFEFINSNRFRIAKTCPCGKSNRDGKFSPIKGYTDKGKCHSCGKFFPPEPSKKITFNFPYELIGIECNLFRYLTQIFDKQKVRAVFDKYKIASKNNDTIFPYINKNNDIVTAKIISYNNDGKRDKSKPPYYMHPKDYEFNMCLFGEHLVQPNEAVYICESEKSALIASIVIGGTWLATGGKANIKLIERINNVKILYPDNDAIDEWSNYGNINYKYLQVIKDKPKGYDVGDYCLDLAKTQKIIINLSNKNYLFYDSLIEFKEMFDLEILECNDNDYINICKNISFLLQLLEHEGITNYYDDGNIKINNLKRWLKESELQKWYLSNYRDLFLDKFQLLDKISSYFCKKYKDIIEIV